MTSRALWLACIWIVFLVRGLFYVSFVPLWEGFDEWAHYAALQNIATGHRALIRSTDPVSREVEASLQLAPMPWQVSGLKHDDYWQLPAEDRKDREEKLRSLPAPWALEPAERGEHVYEAQQAPLYYWLLAPAYRATASLTLPARVWVLRLLGLLAASSVIPLSFLVARKVLQDELRGLGVAALIAALPGLMMAVCHIGNESLAVAVGGLLLWMLFRWREKPRSMGRAIALGAVLGAALLTKAYFLALVPPVFVFTAFLAKRQRLYGQLLAIFGVAAAVSAWWYARNWVLMQSISGEQFDVAARVSGRSGLLESALRMNWLRAADFTFLSHIWLGNWSFLVVRSWMYHFFAIVAGLAGVGLIVRVVRRTANRDLLLLGCIYFTFLLALGYHALRAFQIAGFPGALGYYLFSIVIAEVILVVAGLEAIAPAAWSRAVVPAGVLCFAALEFFGMTFYSIPYYTGFIAHLPNGALPTLRIGQLQDGGWHTALVRLTVNKPPFLTAPVIATLWMFFVAATLGLIVTSVRLARLSERRQLNACHEINGAN